METPLNPAAEEPKQKVVPFRLSLRYKLAFPVVIFVSLMLFLLFYTTFKLVRGLVMEGVEERLTAITDVFAETLKIPLSLENKQDLLYLLYWMTEQGDVLEVRVFDPENRILGTVNPSFTFPEGVLEPEFEGVRRISEDAFVAAKRVISDEQMLGRVLVLFSNIDIEEELKEIFEERLLIAFIMMILLSLLTSVVTWIGIRPLFALEKTARRIVAGDLGARASIHSYDEIEDLGGAFNEMVSRLGKSLDRLRSRTEALEESEEKYRLFVENASDIIFTLTPAGEIILLNRGFSGCTREEILHGGLGLILALHTEESREEFQTAVENVKQGKQPIVNVPVMHIDRIRHYEVFYLANMTPVLDHEQQVKMIQVIMRDITELRRIEMMKESLIRDVAHELKTPAAKFQMALTWFEREMQRDERQEQYQEIVNILKNNTDRLMHTISSIMDLTKLESGVEQIAREELDLNSLLAQLCQEMTPFAREKGLKLDCHPAAAPLRMTGDHHMLYRLFSNLIQNAIKYTPKGSIRVEAVREDRLLHVTITDTGIGIDADDLEKIFERFVQKTAASVGIGVGLTICRDIAALHHGKVWAESSGPGTGATFHATFPAL